MRSYPAGILTIAFFLILGGVFTYRSLKAPIGDYGNYYYAGKFFVDGTFDQGVYETFSFNKKVAAISAEPLYLNYTPVPPISVLFYLPFALMDNIHFSKALFGLTGLFLFLFSFLRLLKFLKISENQLLLLAPIVFFIPFQNNILQGQSYLFILSFMMEGFIQWKQKRTFVASLLWALPIALKIFPAILLLFLLLKKDNKTLVFTLISSVLLSLLPSLFLPGNTTTDYFTGILPRMANGEINHPFAVLYQSAKVLIDKMFIYDLHLNPLPFSDLPWLAGLLHSIYLLVVLTAMILLCLTPKMEDFGKFALILFGGMLLSGYGSSYGLIILLFLFLSLVRMNLSRPQKAIFIFLLLFAGNVPVYKLLSWPILLQFPRLFAFLLLLLLLLYAIRPEWRPLKYFLPVLLLAVAVKLFWQDATSQGRGEYYLPDNRFGIIYDYKAEGEMLQLFFFNAGGDQTETIATRDSFFTDDRLLLIDDQIYAGGLQLTNTNSRKRKPLRLNEKELLYLSDEGRGVGFYTLRRLRLP